MSAVLLAENVNFEVCLHCGFQELKKKCEVWEMADNTGRQTLQ